MDTSLISVGTSANQDVHFLSNVDKDLDESQPRLSVATFVALVASACVILLSIVQVIAFAEL